MQGNNLEDSPSFGFIASIPSPSCFRQQPALS
jgi:hypothetical protein